MAIARAKGKLRGKKPTLSDRQQKELRRMYDTGSYSISDLADLFSVSRPTIYRTPGVTHEILSIFFNNMQDCGIFEERIDGMDEPAVGVKTTATQATGPDRIGKIRPTTVFHTRAAISIFHA